MRPFFSCFPTCFKNPCCQLAVLCLLLSPLSLAADSIAPDSLASKNRITIAVPQVDPWGYYNEQNEPEGALVDLVKALNEVSDLEIDFYLRPLARALRELERGDVDYSVQFTTERVEAVAEQVSKLARMRILTVGAQGLPEAERPRSLDDLAGQRVGYIRGTFYGLAFHQHEGIIRVPVHDIRQGLELLDKQRLSALIGSDMVFGSAYYDSSKKPPPGLEVLFEMEAATAMIYRSHLVPAGDRDRQLQQAMGELRESGWLDKILGSRLMVDSYSP